MSTAEERLSAYRRTIAIIAVIIALYLSFLIIKPFLVAIIGAGVLAYIFYPVNNFILKRTPKFLPADSISALITVFLIIIIVLMPMVLISLSLADEAKNGYHFLQELTQKPGFSLDLPESFLQKFGAYEENIKQAYVNLGTQLINWAQDLIKNIPSAFLSILVTIFSVYFFLKGGKRLYDYCQRVLPLPEGRYREILSRFSEISYSMIYGQVVVGMIQGFLAWIAYFSLGVPNPVLWGFVTAIVSIIPMLGAALVWFPIVIYLLIKGYLIGVYWKAIVMLVYGMLVVSAIDNILKPKLIGDRARIHPLIILFGIIGGIQLIGLPGILIGPMVLALFDVIMEILREVV